MAASSLSRPGDDWILAGVTKVKAPAVEQAATSVARRALAQGSWSYRASEIVAVNLDQRLYVALEFRHQDFAIFAAR